MNILLKTAKDHNLEKQYYELVEWNNNEKNKPLNDFNEKWLEENAIIESDYLFSLAMTIDKQLSFEHAFILCFVLAKYGVLYAKLFVAEYYELKNNIEFALKYYNDASLDFESRKLALSKIKELRKKK